MTISTKKSAKSLTTFAHRLMTLVSLIIATTMTMLVLADSALAQNRQKEEDPEAQAKKDEEWKDKDLRLERRKADGACPTVKVLYDAARYHDFDQGVLSLSKAKYTGEINGVASDCGYLGDKPIEVGMIIGFSLGKGPMAKSDSTVYRYWIAVTQRDKRVLAKQYFTLPVTFEKGQSIINTAVRIEDIVIPRANDKVSGENFEILVGFDVTPEMAAFNAEGKRFRLVN